MGVLVPVRCPDCGAKVDVDRDASQADCRYCGTTSWVQRPEAPQRPVPPNTRIIVMPPLSPARSSAAPVAITAALIGLVVLGAAASLLMLRPTSEKGPDVSVAEGPEPSTPIVPRPSSSFRDAARPLVADLNGDGTEDLLVTEGLGRLLAINGKAGSLLWQSSSAPRYPAFSYLVDGHLAMVSGVEVELVERASGKVQKKLSLDDKAVLPCTAPPGSLRILLSSDEVAKVETKSGKTSLEPKGAPCDEAPSNFADRSMVQARRSHPIGFLSPELNALRCGGISVTGTYTYTVSDPCQPKLGRHDEGSDAFAPGAAIPMADGHIVVGQRTRGRRIGVVGRVENKKLVWLHNASGAEAGEQVEGTLRRVALLGEQVAVISSLTSGERLSSFDTRSGKRLLDVKLPSAAVWLTAANRQWVVVTKNQVLTVDAQGKVKTLYE